TIDEDALLTVRLARRCEGRINAHFVGDVAFGESARDLAGELLAELRVEIQDRDPHALGGKCLAGRGTKAGSAARDDRRDVLAKLHDLFLAISQPTLPPGS